MKKGQFTQIPAVIVVLIFLFTAIPSGMVIAQDTPQISPLSLDETDGIYFIDDFSASSLPRKNCINPSGTTKITLDSQESKIYHYNFSSWTAESDHKAYDYTFPYFTPFLLQNYVVLNYLATEFDDEFGYPLLNDQDDIRYPMQDFATATSFQQIHHFRIKITQERDSISSIQTTWFGKGENVEKITVYVWEPLYSPIGIWREKASFNTSDDPAQLHFEITEEFPISDEGYLDFCVVLTPLFSEKCILFTDYIDVIVQGSGYATHGYIRTPLIKPSDISTWQRADWKDYQPQQTDIKYQILFENETGALIPVPNSILSGNIQKYSSGPLDLSTIPRSYNLSLNASFSTSDLSLSPELYSLGVSWQNNNTSWNDRFGSDLRVQKQKIDNVRIFNGKVSLIQSVYDWTMIHHNSENTRSSPGLGPGTVNSALKWYSNISVGGDQRQPIIKNNHLYIGSSDASRLIMYNNAQATTATNTPNNNIKDKILSFDIKNTPCATNRDTIVVATGSSQSEGAIENVIYGFDDMTLSEEWKFRYRTHDPDHPAICYDASPILHNNKIYITSWSGSTNLLNTIGEYLNLTVGNNKLICLSDQGVFQWEFDLPTASFSSPTASDNLIVVGCENLLNASVFAVNMAGDKVWEQDVGPVGRASPVIHENKVFVVSKKLSSLSLKVDTQITALQLSTGAILWNQTLGDSVKDDYAFAAFNTPCVADDTLVVVTPDGILTALSPTTGEPIWEKQIYNKNLFNQYLTSSPAYADGHIYIGTPDGVFHVYDLDGNEKWTRSNPSASPVISSPIIVDGLVYYYSENGILYCRGKVQIPQGQQITGSITSIPITKPNGQNLTFNRFNAKCTTNQASIRFSILDNNYKTLISDIEKGALIDKDKINGYDRIRLKAEFTANTNGEASLDSWEVTFAQDYENNITQFFSDTFEAEGHPPVCQIEVINSGIGINVSTASYKLEYYDENATLQNTTYLPATCTGENISKNKETISVNLSEENFTVNMSFNRIRFSIIDFNGNLTYSIWFPFTNQSIPDTDKPLFFLDSFTPTGNYISSPTPVCTIKARDKPTEENVSGLDVSSARFEITYQNASGTHTKEFPATVSGINATKSNVTITADVSTIPYASNVTELVRIRFFITDISGNSNQSTWFELDVDTNPPSSVISNLDSIPSMVNTSSVSIIINATDDLSGVNEVALYYRKTSQTSWFLFETKKTSGPYNWDFEIDDDKGGEYELVSIANDNAGNEEEYPNTGEIVFVFDPNPPLKPTFASIYEYTSDNLNTDEIPIFSDITFRDDYLLDMVSYRLNFEGTNEWRMISTQSINQDTYRPTWNLTSSQWDSMEEDITYSLYFRITDVLGNTYETPSSADAMKIRKNFQDGITNFTPDFSSLEQWSWNNVYTISIDTDETDFQSISLYYAYTEKNTTNLTWKQYNESFDNESQSWEFTPTDGDGFYHFRIEMRDSKGSLYTSEVKTFHIQSFPLLELSVIIGLFLVLILVTIILYQKKKKTTI